MANQLLSELAADGAVRRQLEPMFERTQQQLGAADGDVRTLTRRVRILSPSRRTGSSRFLQLLGEALMRRCRVRMTYLTRWCGEVTEREVSPHRLVRNRNTWYLDGWCHMRERLLRFALDAIEEAELTLGRAREIGVRQVEAEMDRGYGVYAGASPQWVTLSFSPHAAQWVSREEWHPDQRSRWTDDGRYELQVPYSDATELAMDIMRHGDGARIVADTGDVASVVRERVRQAWAVHRGAAE